MKEQTKAIRPQDSRPAKNQTPALTTNPDHHAKPMFDLAQPCKALPVRVCWAPVGWFTTSTGQPGGAGAKPLNNFTPHAQQVLALARREADRQDHNYVGTEHLLLGLMALGQGVGANVLWKLGVDFDSLRREVEKIAVRGAQKVVGNIPYTPDVKKTLALAAKEARKIGHTYVGTEHILLGLLLEDEGVAARVLKDSGVDVEKTRVAVLEELDPNIEPKHEITAMPNSEASTIDTSKRYDVYCREMNREIVYRNVLFKATRTIFGGLRSENFWSYLELVQPDGHSIFVSRTSVSRFCEHGVRPQFEISRDTPNP